MFCLGKFEDVFKCLKAEKGNYYGYYEYPTPNSSLFSKCTTEHFKCTTEHFKKIGKDVKYYGIYVVRKRGCNNVLYIGRSGTLDNNGNFKGQDIPKRLKAMRKSGMKANEYFEKLYEREGNLLIEYIVLPKNGRPSPALVEAILLQAYFNENQKLPPKNKEF